MVVCASNLYVGNHQALGLTRVMENSAPPTELGDDGLLHFTSQGQSSSHLFSFAHIVLLWWIILPHATITSPSPYDEEATMESVRIPVASNPGGSAVPASCQAVVVRKATHEGG